MPVDDPVYQNVEHIIINSEDSTFLFNIARLDINNNNFKTIFKNLLKQQDNSLQDTTLTAIDDNDWRDLYLWAQFKYAKLLVQRLDKDDLLAIMQLNASSIPQNVASTIPDDQRQAINSNPQLFKRIQRAAADQSLIKAIDEGRSLGAKTRPNLISILQQLPLAKKRELLTRADIIQRLMVTQDPLELKTLLNDKKLAPEDLDKVVKENTRLTSLYKIQNAGMARVLANVPLKQPMTQAQIDQINAYLNQDEVFPSTAANITLAVGILSSILGVEANTLYTHFGLQAANQFKQDDAIVNQLYRQHDYNRPFIRRRPGPDEKHEQLLLAFLKNIKKNNPLEDGEVAQLLTDLKTKKTRKEIIEHLVTTHPTVFAKNAVVESLTSQIYAEIKQTKNLEAWKNPGETSDELRARLKPQYEFVSSIWNQRQEFQEKLEAITQATSPEAIAPLNPIFSNSAKEQAAKVKTDYEAINVVVEERLTKLKEQKKELRALQASIPRNIPRSKIDNYNMLQGEISRASGGIDRDIQKLESIQKKFHPDNNSQDPILKRGILGTLEHLAQGNKEFVLKSTAQIKIEHKILKSSDALTPINKQNPNQDNKPNIKLQAGKSALNHYFKEKEALKSGEKRETIMTTATGDQLRMVKEPDPGKSSPKVSIWDKIDNPQEKVPAYMLLALDYLRDLEKLPENERAKRHELTAKTPEHAAMLWTALIVLGRNVPGLKFKPEAISVYAPQGFDPKTQLGFFGNFTKNSMYKQYFENNPAVATTIEDCKNEFSKKFNTVNSDRSFGDQMKKIREKEQNQGINTGPSQKKMGGPN